MKQIHWLLYESTHSDWFRESPNFQTWIERCRRVRVCPLIDHKNQSKRTQNWHSLHGKLLERAKINIFRAVVNCKLAYIPQLAYIPRCWNWNSNSALRLVTRVSKMEGHCPLRIARFFPAITFHFKSKQGHESFLSQNIFHDSKRPFFQCSSCHIILY